MQFSDTGTKLGLVQDFEFWTGQGDGVVSGNATRLANFVRLANHHYEEIVIEILQSLDGVDWDDPNHTNQPIFTFPLVANQRDYNIPLSEKLLRIKRVDVCYDGTGNTCYESIPIDSGQINAGLGNDTEIDKSFNKSAPRHDLQNNGYTLKLYPMADASNVSNSGLIRVDAVREPDLFTSSDTTQEPGFDEPFHRLISMQSARDWLAVNKPKSVNLIRAVNNQITILGAKMKSHYGSKQTDRQFVVGAEIPNYE